MASSQACRARHGSHPYILHVALEAANDPKIMVEAQTRRKEITGQFPQAPDKIGWCLIANGLSFHQKPSACGYQN
jgi:hypothetical protein